MRARACSCVRARTCFRRKLIGRSSRSGADSHSCPCSSPMLLQMRAAASFCSSYQCCCRVLLLQSDTHPSAALSVELPLMKQQSYAAAYLCCCWCWAAAATVELF